MAESPASIPPSWSLCRTARRFRAAVASNLSADNDETLPVKKVVEKVDGNIAEGECLLGELTDIGRQNTYEFGRDLRRLYVERLGFLPDTALSDDQLYFRSTNVPRTVESLHQIIHGLYPAKKCANGYMPQHRIRNGMDENLFGNTAACKRLEILEVAFARAAAESWSHALEPLDKKISKYIGGNPIRLDGKPRASGVFDTIRAAIANGVPVPKDFTDPQVMDIIEDAVVDEWFGAYQSEEVRRLGMGRLLSDLSAKIEKKAQQGVADPMRILVHSVHDTTLASICATLDVFDKRWPPFTSSISFELFRKRAKESPSGSSPWQKAFSAFNRPNMSDHYIRMRYQNRNLVLPICANEGKHLPGHPEFCTLAAFRDRVRELTPADWEAECAASGKA
ncbi:hypothetical protein PHLCEN_2v7347 [Hermanssonia centrifuga]|uniref:Phosphoglycerate mutase-like protein n=1 Tax=Hermanssonia centrifuga TaxID=98765 RepID=A0A2R6NWU4_9APHY|nr:hypothetical protein PHLCEN_2v7347 [Hermanssonia centrifuga]